VSLDADVDEAQRDSVSDGGSDNPRTAKVVGVVVRISGRRQHGLHVSSYQVTTASRSCHAHTQCSKFKMHCVLDEQGAAYLKERFVIIKEERVGRRSSDHR